MRADRKRERGVVCTSTCVFLPGRMTVYSYFFSEREKGRDGVAKEGAIKLSVEEDNGRSKESG